MDHEVAAGHIARLFQRDAGGQQFPDPPGGRGVGVLRGQPGEVELDLAVGHVDPVIQPGHRLHNGIVGPFVKLDDGAEHRLDIAADADDLAGDIGKGQRRRAEDAVVQRGGGGKIGALVRGFRQKPQQGGMRRAHQRQGQNHDGQVEGDMAVQDLAGGAGSQKLGRERKDGQRSQGQGRRPAAQRQIGQRHRAHRGFGPARQHHRDQRAAEVGAQHQLKPQFRRHHAARRQRHDQQDEGDRGMEKPRPDGRDQKGGERIAREIADHQGQEAAFAQRLGRLPDQAQRQEQQPHPHQDAPDLPPDPPLGRQKDHRARHQRQRHDQGQIQRQQPHHQRRTEVRPQRAPQRGGPADQAAACQRSQQQVDRGRALKGDGKDGADQRGRDRAGHRALQMAAQDRPARPLDPGAHHSRGVKQERHRPGQMDKHGSPAHRAGPGRADPAVWWLMSCMLPPLPHARPHGTSRRVARNWHDHHVRFGGMLQSTFIPPLQRVRRAAVRSATRESI